MATTEKDGWSKEARLLTLCVASLVAANVWLVHGRSVSSSKLAEVRSSAAAATLEAAYADEEQALLLEQRYLAALEGQLPTDPSSGEVDLVLISAIGDCNNCIEDEFRKLNEILAKNPGPLRQVRGFFVDEDRPEEVRRLIDHLVPAPEFPLDIENVLEGEARATTPLVLVVRSRDGRILDAHKPIPENLAKRDTFYKRWALRWEDDERSPESADEPSRGS